VRLIPLGDQALTLDCGEPADPAAVALAGVLARRLSAEPIDGIAAVVPAFAAVSVFGAPEAIDRIAELLPTMRPIDKDSTEARPAPAGGGDERSVHVIPVCHDPGLAPDLAGVAGRAGMTVDDLIACHAAGDYSVLAVGFVPGFAYLGGLDARLHVPRLETPRARVPAGAVALAAGYTGIYPAESPGGWNLIGRTPLPPSALFDPARTARPALFRPGDRVRFRPVSRAEFDAWK
jgi:inhibitor of KinA